jgi:hypothetical protein
MMRAILQIVLILGFATATIDSKAVAADSQILKVKVSDIEGRPMEGAKLFLYDSANVRRPADFISALSDRTGRMQIILPPGKYWGVARFKADGKYGPLLPGDKHSGEPIEVDLTLAGGDADFVVSDIRELGQKKRASSTDLLRLRGRALDAQGVPVAQVFVFANITREFGELPDFVSAWTGEDGRYELYLPPGNKYYISASRQLPLKSQEERVKPVVVEPEKIDIAMDINLTVQ